MFFVMFYWCFCEDVWFCVSLNKIKKTFAEKGEFLALDLGGSKFKVLQVKVREDEGIKRGVQMKEKTYPIPNELLRGKGTEVGRHAVNEAEEWGGSILLRDMDTI